MDPVNVQAKFVVRSFTRSWDNSGYLKTLGSPWIRRSRSSKVVDFGTIQKRVYDFLLVHNSNQLVLSRTVSDIDVKNVEIKIKNVKKRKKRDKNKKTFVNVDKKR